MRRKTWGALFLEVFLIAFAVFLGMWVSDWSASRKLRQDRKAMLRAIKQELIQNQARLEQRERPQQSFLVAFDSLQAVLTETNKQEPFYDRSFRERLPGWTGIGSTNQDNSMFEAAQYSQVLIGMDIELLGRLSKTYRLQENLNDLHHTYLDRFYGIDSTTRYGEVIRLVNQMRQELWGGQKLLAREYAKTIKTLEELGVK